MHKQEKQLAVFSEYVSFLPVYTETEGNIMKESQGRDEHGCATPRSCALETLKLIRVGKVVVGGEWDVSGMGRERRM